MDGYGQGDGYGSLFGGKKKERRTKMVVCLWLRFVAFDVRAVPPTILNFKRSFLCRYKPSPKLQAPYKG